MIGEDSTQYDTTSTKIKSWEGEGLIWHNFYKDKAVVDKEVIGQQITVTQSK